MSEECNHNCDECGEKDCSSRTIEKLKPHSLSSFKKTIAIISGKGGVGKSLITSLLAVSLAKKNKKVAIMDADVTGPSIPQAFGLAHMQCNGDENGIYPIKSKLGIEIMSANLMLDTPETPIIWRGPMISSFVGQLYSEVIYGEMEYLLIDMPPGTGDVPLTVFQQLHVDGIIIVSSPQELVSMVVAKSINMAKEMNIKILGIVENMSYVTCPKCGEKIDVFGSSHLEAEIKKFNLPLLAELPLNPAIAKKVDEGKIEELDINEMNQARDLLLKL
jgi:Mrp family chromosome partitioning ATPase